MTTLFSFNAMAQKSPEVISCLEIYDIDSRTHTIIKEFPFLVEAPNWTPDGKWLVVNSSGRLYKISPDGSTGLVEINSGSIHQCNNDHVITSDGRWIGLSSNDPSAPNPHASYIFIMPFEGGEPRRITPMGPSYLHGISPDGKNAAYCAFRGEDNNADIYVISKSVMQISQNPFGIAALTGKQKVAYNHSAFHQAATVLEYRSPNLSEHFR